MNKTPDVRPLVLVAAFAAMGAFSPLACAATLITGDNFESYADGRLSTASSSVWASSTLTKVASGAGLAFSGSKYVELGTSTANQTGSRTFTGTPTTGTYWAQFSVYDMFNQAQVTDAASLPQIRFGDATNNLATVLFRADNSNIVFNYVPVAGGSATSVTTSINYDSTSAWHTFTYAIDLDNHLAAIYLDNTLIVPSFSFTGYGSTLSKIDFRGKLTVSGTALLIDDVGFYSTSPLAAVPEPAACSVFGGVAALLFCAVKRRYKA